MILVTPVFADALAAARSAEALGFQLRDGEYFSVIWRAGVGVVIPRPLGSGGSYPIVFVRRPLSFSPGDQVEGWVEEFFTSEGGCLKSISNQEALQIFDGSGEGVEIPPEPR